MTKQNLINAIEMFYPQLKPVCASEFFGHESTGIWFKDTESTLINGRPVINCDYVVNEKLERLLEKFNFFGEPYDLGTLIAYPM
jgi:hypothetical protein